MSKSDHILKSTAIITIILVISKVMGFLRELLVASQIGANRASDIFKVATRMPNLFYACFASALVVTFIPVFANVKNDKEEANMFFNNILNILILITVICSIVGIILSPFLTSILAAGFDGEDFIKTSEMTKIVMPSIIFLSLSGLYTGYLQSYGKFTQPAMTGIAADIVIIVGVLVFYNKFGVIAAVVAFLLSSIAQVLIQRPFMQNGYRYKFYINFKDKNVRKMLILAVPMLISTAVSQINVIVDSNYASKLIAGSISVVDYASKLSSIINQVFIVSITTVIYPMLTEKYANKDMDGFKSIFNKGISIILIVVIPLMFGLAVLSTPVIELLLEHGHFNRSATLATSHCLKILSFSTLGYSLMDILGKIFFSIKDTVTPMINGFIMIALNIILIVTLVPKIGITGLVLATTISATVIPIIMLVELKLKLKTLELRKIGIIMIKSFIAGGVMAAAVWSFYGVIDRAFKLSKYPDLIIKIASSTLIGIAVYAVILYILKVEELRDLVYFKKKKLS